MAASKVTKFSSKKAGNVTLDEKMRAWAKRKSSTGVSWRDVSATSLRVALSAALSDGAALMFSAAAGGTGVCLTLFQDGDRLKEYAMTAEELNILLEGVGEAFASGSEDMHQAMVDGAS